MENRKNNSILSSMVSVSSIVVIAKLVGFIKQMITANVFGASTQTDIISLAEGFVSNLDYLLVQALSTAFIPIYIHTLEKGDDEASRFTSDTLSVLFLITFTIATIVFFGASGIAKVLAPSYAYEEYKQLSIYIKLFAPALILIVELAIFNAILKANKRFIPGELIGFNQSIIIILLVFYIGSQYGPDTLVIGFYVYTIFNLCMLMILSRGFWGIKVRGAFGDPNVRRLLKMMGPLLLGYSVVFINQQVDKIIVSGFESGTVTAMNYASVLSNFVTSFIGSICGVLFTYITHKIASGNDREAASLTTQSITQLITLVIPISAITIMNARDIVQIVFGRGKFNENAVNICATALIGYAFMFVPFVAREIYSRFQYGYEDSKRPMINSTIGIIMNTILSILLSKVVGIIGVTLATSISVAICGLLNYYSSKRKNNFIGTSEFKNAIGKWAAGVVLCIVSSLLGHLLIHDAFILVRFTVITIFSLLLYGITTFSIVKTLLYRIKEGKR